MGNDKNHDDLLMFFSTKTENYPIKIRLFSNNSSRLYPPNLTFNEWDIIQLNMSQNTFEIETVRQVNLLIKELGLAECKRLGFIYENSQGIMSLSTSGLGYLLFIKGRGITRLEEAFAAGRECAFEEIEDKK